MIRKVDHDESHLGRPTDGVCVCVCEKNGPRPTAPSEGCVRAAYPPDRASLPPCSCHVARANGLHAPTIVLSSTMSAM
jgi:hypothetical protein